jgi:uncharacterized protein YndB with AHSA1/START domain
VATALRTRTVAAPVHEVWRLIRDPGRMAQWWPAVVRMEAVQDDRWTQVFTTKKGRSVRLDYHLLASDPPDDAGTAPARRAWEQDVSGTPFARVLEESVTEILLEPDGPATRITIAQRQKLKGRSRTGGFLLRRATSKKLDEALDGIERAVVPGARD